MTMPYAEFVLIVGCALVVALAIAWRQDKADQRYPPEKL